MIIKTELSFLLLSLFLIFSPTLATYQLLSSPNFITGGQWSLLQSSIGLSAMHMQLLHNNKVVMFDRTDFGPSNLPLPTGQCRFDNLDTALKIDCTAHSLLYDINANTVRPLKVQTDTWCSSGAVLPNGTLVQTGGFNDGDHVVRTLAPCSTEECDWTEYPGSLSERRWYATDQILPDDRVIIIGGRREFNYEFYPRSSGETSYSLNFLRETRDNEENNLYPFMHLLPDGNLFIFANTQSISFDYVHNRVVREFPVITGGEPRNYPSSGSSVLLPLRLTSNDHIPVEAEVLVCGGAPQGAFFQAERGGYVRASSTCGRLKVTDENPKWVMEEMPMARVMSDMLLLPTGDVIIINGAGSGTAGWDNAREPVTCPVVYRTSEPISRRFSVMNPSQTPRLYHSSAILLPDGRILVGGSNPNKFYNFTGVQFPTDLSLEAYSPPYLSPEFTSIRPAIVSINEALTYREVKSVSFTVPVYRSQSEVSVTIVAPSFTTHSLGMHQRLVALRVNSVSFVLRNVYELTFVGPSTAEIAPRGYYLLFVVHSGIPSSGSWVKIQ